MCLCESQKLKPLHFVQGWRRSCISSRQSMFQDSCCKIWLTLFLIFCHIQLNATYKKKLNSMLNHTITVSNPPLLPVVHKLLYRTVHSWRSYWLSRVAEVITLLNCMWEVTGSCIGWDTGHPFSDSSQLPF